jgi:hypothetical protein
MGAARSECTLDPLESGFGNYTCAKSDNGMH